MRAESFKAFGMPLELICVADPEPGEGEVVLKVGRCGLCGTDLHMTEAGSHGQPGSILGHEYSGEFVALGKVLFELRIGDHVAECFGKPGLLAASIATVRPRGTIFSLGFCMAPEPLHLLDRRRARTDSQISSALYPGGVSDRTRIVGERACGAAGDDHRSCSARHASRRI